MVGYLQRQLRSKRAAPSASIFITSATIQLTIGTRAFVNYNAPVNAGDFVPGTFLSTPSGRTGNAILQSTPVRLRVAFGGDITADTNLTYSGAVPNVLTPQTVPYT